MVASCINRPFAPSDHRKMSSFPKWVLQFKSRLAWTLSLQRAASSSALEPVKVFNWMRYASIIWTVIQTTVMKQRNVHYIQIHIQIRHLATTINHKKYCWTLIHFPFKSMKMQMQHEISNSILNFNLTLKLFWNSFISPTNKWKWAECGLFHN